MSPGAGIVLVYAALIAAAALAERYLRKALRVSRGLGRAQHPPPVSVIKPVTGLPPAAEALWRGWLEQDYPAEVQLIFSLQEPADPALPLLRRLEAEAGCDVIVNPVRAGFGGKTSNLWHGVRRARHDLIVFSDADMAAEPDTLRRFARRFEHGPQVVAGLPLHVSCGGLWSQVYAHVWNAVILYGFALPMVVWRPSGVPGGTVALTRAALERVGGVEAIRDYLAEDIALGRRAVQAGLLLGLGPTLRSPVGPMSFTALHEKLLRGLLVLITAQPLGRLLVLPLAVVLSGYLAVASAAAVSGDVGLLAWSALFLAARMVLQGLLERHATGRFRPFWAVPVVDLVLVALLLRAWPARTVRWCGLRYRVRRNGRMERLP